MKKKKNNKTKEFKITEKSKKKFIYLFIVWIFIFAIGLVKKTLQNDTFYTIKIGELIFSNGIDMMDHFSFHQNLAYTYPHWLYDCFIYIIYNFFGYTGIYISSILLLLLLLLIVFKTNIKNCNNISIAAFGTFICALSISSFVTARAQLVSFILFALQICFIEMFLKQNKKKYLCGLLLISLMLCNIHVAVWPFYFILYLPYLAEYLISYIFSKIKLKKENKFIKFLKNKFILEKNKNIKYIFIIMILSLITGLITPIKDTPYTYLIKTMMGNSQNYIQEHQMITWINSPFTIIIAFETIFLAFLSKIKLRDLFMICGLVLMSIVSVRHLSLLALIGTICFARVFSMFLESFNFKVDNIVIKFLSKKNIIIASFILVTIFTSLMLNMQLKKEFIDYEIYPTKAVKYIKENIDLKNAKIFNEYNYGSYLVLNDIPVFIDSRADLYTKQFSGFEYDIFDDYEYIIGNYQEKFEFYGITHVLLSKKDNPFYKTIQKNNDYTKLYEDEYFIFYEKSKEPQYIIKFEN